MGDWQRLGVDWLGVFLQFGSGPLVGDRVTGPVVTGEGPGLGQVCWTARGGHVFTSHSKDFTT